MLKKMATSRTTNSDQLFFIEGSKNAFILNKHLILKLSFILTKTAIPKHVSLYGTNKSDLGLFILNVTYNV